MLYTLPALLSLPMRFGNIDTCMTQLIDRGGCWDEAPWSLRCWKCGRNSLCRGVRREGKGAWACLNQRGRRVGGSWEPLVGMGWGWHWRGAQEKQGSSPGSIMHLTAKQPVHSYSSQIQGRPAERDSDGFELKRPDWHFLEGWHGWSVENNQDHQLAGDVLLWMPTEGQWDTVPGWAPGVTVLQKLLEFNKALEDSRVKAAFCIALCGLCLSALFINRNTCTMNHVCTLWLFITVFSPFFLFKIFCYKVLNLTESLSMFPRREPLNSLYIFLYSACPNLLPETPLLMKERRKKGCS